MASFFGQGLYGEEGCGLCACVAERVFATTGFVKGSEECALALDLEY